MRELRCTVAVLGMLWDARAPAATIRTALALIAVLMQAAGPALGGARDEARTPNPGAPHAATALGASPPPTGRSLFDFVVTAPEGRKDVAVPFPFSALLSHLGEYVEGGTKEGIKRVLIPLGRSLQRNAAGEEPFAYPRVVAAVVGEARERSGSAHVLLRDRLYLGYHEKAGALEVISYNEVAGRFEFQIVKDYREGARPRILYANRNLCLSCHQNEGPIFSRPTWDETDANPLVADMLQRERPDFYGIVPSRNVDVPNAIDDAIQRANRLSVTQVLWRQGCEQEGRPDLSVRCRAGVFLAALTYRLGGGRYVHLHGRDADSDTFRLLAASWKTRWPEGVSVSDPNVLNRNPFAPLAMPVREVLDRRSLLRMAEIDDVFDPLRTRQALERWTSDRSLDVERFVRSVAGFVSAADVRAIDRYLVRTSARSRDGKAVHRMPCSLQRRPATGGRTLLFECRTDAQDADIRAVSGRVEGQGAGAIEGTVEHIWLGGGLALRDLAVRRVGSPARRHADETTWVTVDAGLSARLPDGRRIGPMTLRGKAAKDSSGSQPSEGEIEITLIEDVSRLQTAIDAVADDSLVGRNDAFGAEPLRGTAVMKPLFARLGLPARQWCCIEPGGTVLPEREQPVQGTGVSSASLQPFYRACAACHSGRERFPPGFLSGDAARAATNVDGCAERILYRIAMWDVAQAHRSKTPMPPASAPQSHGFERSAEFGAIRDYLKQRIVEKGGSPLSETALAARRYEELPPCIPLFD